MGGSKSGRCQGEGILVRGKGRVKGPEAGCMLDTAKEYHEASVALSTEIVSMGEGCWEQSQKWGWAAGLLSHWKHQGFYAEEDGEPLEGFNIRRNSPNSF